MKKKKEEPKKMNLILEMWRKRDMEENLEKSKEAEKARKETRIQESPQVNIDKNNLPRLSRGKGEAEDQQLRKEDLEGVPEIRKKEDTTGIEEEIEAVKKEAAAKPAIKVDLNLNAGSRRNLEGSEARKTGIKEGSKVRKREAETGAIPKVRIDLDPGNEKEKEERKGLQEWRSLDLARRGRPRKRWTW